MRHIAINPANLLSTWRCSMVLAALWLAGPVAAAEPLHYGGCWLKDFDGRYFNPKGFVVVMDDNVGSFDYNADDYRRMVRYGANVQVIRIGIGPLSGLQGEAEQQRYLDRVDQRVRLAKAAGIRTIFKMTVYRLPGFAGKWDSIYRRDGEFRAPLLAAWTAIWQKYASEPFVTGYDLINEPFREQGEAEPRPYEDVVQNSLIPLYTDLIGAMVAVAPDKWAIYQPLLVDVDDRKNHPLPCLPIAMPKVHDRMIFAPHGYFDKAAQHELAVRRHQQEAKSSGAALMMGEWGRQTYAIHDADLAAQQAYTKLYIDVSSVFDAAGMGMIKPWFTGTRTPDGARPKYTWSVFSDAAPTGSVERKYIMDVIARPFPLFISGATVQSYAYQFTDRTFNLAYTPGGALRGPSEIYIPEDRHYPDGFTVTLAQGLVLARDRTLPAGLRVLAAPAGSHAESFRYDEQRQRLILEQWPAGKDGQWLRVQPGLPWPPSRAYP